MPKVLHMPKRTELRENAKAILNHSPTIPVMPDSDEEHASFARVNKWVELADTALMQKDGRRKIA